MRTLLKNNLLLLTSPSPLINLQINSDRGKSASNIFKPWIRQYHCLDFQVAQECAGHAGRREEPPVLSGFAKMVLLFQPFLGPHPQSAYGRRCAHPTKAATIQFPGLMNGKIMYGRVGGGACH